MTDDIVLNCCVKSSLRTYQSNCSLHVVNRSVNLLLKMYIEVFSWYHSKQGTLSRVERWFNRFSSANSHGVTTVESQTFIRPVPTFMDWVKADDRTTRNGRPDDRPDNRKSIKGDMQHQSRSDRRQVRRREVNRRDQTGDKSTVGRVQARLSNR